MNTTTNNAVLLDTISQANEAQVDLSLIHI